MKTLFIADIHLDKNEPEITKSFLDFLAMIKTSPTEINALYILGDLFEAWIGDDDESSFHLEIIQALKSMTKNKIAIYLMPGNRDFLMSQSFAAQTGCQLLKDPTMIKLHTHDILLTHGDLLCSQDFQYQLFRRFIQYSWIKKITLTLPLKLRQTLARHIRQMSKNRKAKLNPQKNISKKIIKKMMQQYRADYLIHGHIHQAGIYHDDINDQNKTRIALNAWDTLQENVLACEDGKISWLSF